MPGFNWRESQGQAIGSGVVSDAEAEGGDWRIQLPSGSRHRIVNKFLDILKKHPPFSGEEGLQGLEETAVWFEESIFTTATSQICLKLLGIEMKSQKLKVNSLQITAAGTSRNSEDSGRLFMKDIFEDADS